MIQKCAGVAGLGAMNGLCYPDTDEGFLHTLASTAARTSPAQPIWESNIDTHFLTSGWRARGSGGLSNESLPCLCCDLWLVRAAEMRALQTPDSTSRWRGEH